MWHESHGCDEVHVGANRVCDNNLELGQSWSANVMKAIWDVCEGDTTMRPLLLSEILWKGKLIRYEHTSRLLQWLSSVL